MEIADKDVNKAFKAAVGISINILADLHTISCCVCATAPAWNVVTWRNIKLALQEDREMQDLMAAIKSGFPLDSRALPSHVRPYAPNQLSLYTVDDVVMLGDRVIIPQGLRPAVLHLLHAALQGVAGMKARSAEAVY